MPESTFSLSFTSSTDQVDLGNVAILSGATAATWSFWVKPSDFTGNRIWTKWGSTSATRAWLISFETDGRVTVAFQDGSSNFNIKTTVGALSAGAWTNIGVTFTAPTTVNVYFNGILQSLTVLLNSAIPSIIQGTGSMQIGFESGESSGSFQGGMDDAAIWTVALTAGQIAALAYEESVPQDFSSGLVGLWHFDEGSGTSTTDASGNGNTGTLNGGVTWSNDVPVQLSGLIYFVSAANSGDLAATSSFSGSVTWSNGSRGLFVTVPFMGAAGSVSMMTYGGASCTFIGAQNVVGGTGRVELWRILQGDAGAPASGVNTLVVTYSGVIADTSVQWECLGNVHQTMPTEGFSGNSGINTGSAADATDVVIPIANNDWVMWGLVTSQMSGISSSNTGRNLVTGAGGMGGQSDTGGLISPSSPQTGRWMGNGITSAWAVVGVAVRNTLASGGPTNRPVNGYEDSTGMLVYHYW